MKYFFFKWLLCCFCLLLYAKQSNAVNECNQPVYPDQLVFEECIQNTTTMTWDSNTLVDDIAPKTSVSVAVIEGIGPYRWTVSGNGFYLDSGHSIKNVISESGSITIYTHNACGTGVISVSDNCSTVFFEIRSTDGQWVLTAQGDINTAIPCPFMAPLADWKKLTSGDYELIRGRIKLINSIWALGGSGACDYEGSSYPICGSAWVDKSCWPNAASFCVSDIIDKQVEGNHPGFEGKINVIGGCVNYNGRDSECFGGSGRVCGIYQVRGILSIYEWKCHDE